MVQQGQIDHLLQESGEILPPASLLDPNLHAELPSTP